MAHSEEGKQGFGDLFAVERRKIFDWAWHKTALQRRALVTRGTSGETPKRPYRLSAEQCRGRNALLARTMKKRNLLEFLCFDTNKIERGSQNNYQILK